MLIRISRRDKWSDGLQVVKRMVLITSSARNIEVSYADRIQGFCILCESL